MRFAQGDRFDRYVISAPLGSGSTGEVYRALDERLRRTVALKLLRDDPGAPRDRLLAEARAAASIEHPNAVSIYDVGEHDGVPYLAMELVEGRPLRAYVGDPDVALEAKLAWLASIGRALQAAHSRGVLHRDLRPENVFVRDDGVVKVADFGVTHAGPMVSPAAITSAKAPVAAAPRAAPGVGHVAGTLAYRAPEQLRGETIDAAADQWAWGVVAYELLTGVLPWNAAHGDVGMAVEIAGREPEPMRARGVDVGDAIERIVARAMAKERGARFGSVGELVGQWMSATASFLGPARTGGGEGAGAGRSGSARRPRRHVAKIVGGVLIACTVLGATLALERARGSHRDSLPLVASVATPVGSASPRKAFSVVFDRAPDPRVSRAYAAAMQAMRDASIEEAFTNLGRALEIDPAFAPARLELVLVDRYIDESTRVAYQRVYEQRGALNERERSLLAAVEPIVRAEPDAKEAATKLRGALEQSPGDDDVRYQLARAYWFDGDLERARDTLEDLLGHDPSFALAWHDLGQVAEWLGDKSRAVSAYESCLAAASSATQCLTKLAGLQAREGMCREAETTARRAIATSPEDYTPYEQLAEALQGSGAPLEAVRAAIEQGISHLEPESQPHLRAMWRTRLAAMSGDFEAVLKGVVDWEATQPERTGAAYHLEPLELEVGALTEMGRPAAAHAALKEFLRRASAWTTTGYVLDPRFIAASMLYRTGGLPRSEFAAQRDAWLTAGGTSHQLADWISARDKWWFGFAVPTITREDAKEALGAVARLPPLANAPIRDPAYDAVVADVYRLVPDLDAAMPYLARSAVSCMAMTEPFLHYQSLLAYGEALASREDRAGACAAFGTLTAAWGTHRARSITADRARNRSIALRCP